MRASEAVTVARGASCVIHYASELIADASLIQMDIGRGKSTILRVHFSTHLIIKLFFFFVFIWLNKQKHRNKNIKTNARPAV